MTWWNKSTYMQNYKFEEEVWLTAPKHYPRYCKGNCWCIYVLSIAVS